MRNVALSFVVCLACGGPPRSKPMPAAQQTSASPRTSCPPEIRRLLPTYGGSFTLPPPCAARCETGIDTVEATVVCDGVSIDYSGAFEATIQLALPPSGTRVAGREGSGTQQLYWGSTSEGELCAILLLGSPGERLQHQFCARQSPRPPGYSLLLELARSWKNTEVPEARAMCPYCG